MTQIHVLDSETIDKIAAGEVVERPSSVVKELVENAIDAGATAITVEAKDGGIEFLRVTDNGSGMEASQIRTAFLRHATSKISSVDDLMHVNSLGFRGEALSSIAAVSKVEVITKTRDALTGIRFVMEGAQEKSFEEVGAPDGTTFIMRNLFYNTPVRRKFLKTPATEGGYIAELMEHLALSRPDISFKFTLGSQVRFHTSGNGDLKEVIYRLYGRDIASQLVPVQEVRGGIRLEGYLGKPILVRSNRNFEIYFMNRRFIRSQLIAKALEEGYREYLMQHKFPLCVLHIYMENETVDVNVHPTKMDVRFSDGPAFCNLLAAMVRDTLHHREMIPEASLSGSGAKETSGTSAAAASDPADEVGGKKKRAEYGPESFEKNRSDRYRVMEENRYRAGNPGQQLQDIHDMLNSPLWSRVLEGRKPGEAIAGQEDDFFQEAAPLKEDAVLTKEDAVPLREELPINGADLTKKAAQPAPAALQQENPAAMQQEGIPGNDILAPSPQQMNLFEEKLLKAENRSRYHMIGQIFDTYWILQFEDKMFIIDQHAAHEKVKYERLIRQYREHEVISQSLLPPVIISLTGQEALVLQENMDAFTSLGFEIEEFGGNEYALRSVPADLYGCSERQMFLEVLDGLTEGAPTGNLKSVEEKIASMSCKAAVKGNHRLTPAEAEKLVDELLTLDNPYNCPHGRPTIISMTKTELEKKFKRIL